VAHSYLLTTDDPKQQHGDISNHQRPHLMAPWQQQQAELYESDAQKLLNGSDLASRRLIFGSLDSRWKDALKELSTNRRGDQANRPDASSAKPARAVHAEVS
jgi:hypothetical protein